MNSQQVREGQFPSTLAQKIEKLVAAKRVREGETPCTIEEAVMPFGKYKGRLVTVVLGEDPEYLFWVSEQEKDIYTPFDLLVRKLMENQPAPDSIIPFGIHRGKHFSELMDEYSYIQYWIKKQENEGVTGIMARFLEYVGANL